MSKSITVETVVKKDADAVWEYWNGPEHIMQWLHASDDWECPKATNDVRVGGKFLSTMGAKDKSTSFDFRGVYTAVEKNKFLAYDAMDGRKMSVTFEEVPGGVHVSETFELEDINPEEMQRGGWQAILDNFKSYAESK